MASLTPLSSGHFLLEGDTSKNVVPALVESGWQALSAAEESILTIDFSMVVHADSATLAMLLEWMKRAQSVSKTIILTSFPEELHALSDICGLDQVFETSSESCQE